MFMNYYSIAVGSTPDRLRLLSSVRGLALRPAGVPFKKQ